MTKGLQHAIFMQDIDYLPDKCTYLNLIIYTGHSRTFQQAICYFPVVCIHRAKRWVQSQYVLIQYWLHASDNYIGKQSWSLVCLSACSLFSFLVPTTCTMIQGYRYKSISIQQQQQQPVRSVCSQPWPERLTTADQLLLSREGREPTPFLQYQSQTAVV